MRTNQNDKILLNNGMSEEIVFDKSDKAWLQIQKAYVSYARGMTSEKEMRERISRLLMQHSMVSKAQESLEENDQLSKDIIDAIILEEKNSAEEAKKQSDNADRNVISLKHAKLDNSLSFKDECAEAYAWAQCVRRNHGWSCHALRLRLGDISVLENDNEFMSFLFVNEYNDHSLLRREWPDDMCIAYNAVSNIEELRQNAPESYKRLLEKGLDYYNKEGSGFKTFYNNDYSNNEENEEIIQDEDRDSIISFQSIINDSSGFVQSRGIEGTKNIDDGESMWPDDNDNIIVFGDTGDKEKITLKDECAEAYAWMRYTQRINGWYSDNPIKMSLKDGEMYDNGGTCISSLFADEDTGRAMLHTEWPEDGFFKLKGVVNLKEFKQNAPTSYNKLIENGLKIYRSEGVGFRALYLKQLKNNGATDNRSDDHEKNHYSREYTESADSLKAECSEAYAWMLHTMKTQRIFGEALRLSFEDVDDNDGDFGERIISLFEDWKTNRAILRVDWPEYMHYKVYKLVNLNEIKESMPKSYNKMVKSGLNIYHDEGTGFKAFYRR